MKTEEMPIGKTIFCIKCGSKHTSYPTYLSLCLDCKLYFCPSCNKWMSFDDYKGDFKETTRKCSSCRIKGKRNRRGGTLSVKLRFSILLRDNFRCVYCGRSANETTLEVDHKIPVSKGGGDECSNLVTACSKCNLGKSNLLIPANCFPAV